MTGSKTVICACSQGPSDRRQVRVGRGVPGVGAVGWVLGGWYTGYYPSPTLPGTGLVLPGPNPCPDTRFCVHSGTPGPCRALRTPELLALSRTLLEPIRARFHLIYTKVSINLECHRFSVMRPGIVPVSKTGSQVTTLNFQDSTIGQPSLTRNKWSRIRLTPWFMVKTAKCRHNVHTMVRTGTVYGCRTDQYPRTPALPDCSSLILQPDLAAAGLLQAGP